MEDGEVGGCGAGQGTPGASPGCRAGPVIGGEAELHEPDIGSGPGAGGRREAAHAQAEAAQGAVHALCVEQRGPDAVAPRARARAREGGDGGPDEACRRRPGRRQRGPQRGLLRVLPRHHVSEASGRHNLASERQRGLHPDVLGDLLPLLVCGAGKGHLLDRLLRRDRGVRPAAHRLAGEYGGPRGGLYGHIPAAPRHGLFRGQPLQLLRGLEASDVDPLDQGRDHVGRAHLPAEARHQLEHHVRLPPVRLLLLMALLRDHARPGRADHLPILLALA
mmetsp:Transcript_61127/g.178676  ORF Transcript_61127/g.178676 Transcript_61127/m.178676 type:complete len:277 (+) Transcript_61127:302-1132(+)